MNFSSKDFGKTQNRIDVHLPDKLLHKNVRGNGEEKHFSNERKHPVYIVDLPSKSLSMTIGGLLPHQQTNFHRHTYETIIYIQKGKGTSFIEDQKIHWEAGDAVYIPVWAWHSHRNDTDDDCIYIACENTPILQNLGVAIREEKE